jgi:acetyl-CoA carboxylase carboxyl transferase subunit alpha
MPKRKSSSSSSSSPPALSDLVDQSVAIVQSRAPKNFAPRIAIILGIGIGDKVFMLENTWYSVISPESCSSILWRSWDYKQQAAEALKLTSKDMLSNKLIDAIIKEPLGGAHYDRDMVYENVRKVINKQLKDLLKLDAQDRIETRIEKFCSMGVINE